VQRVSRPVTVDAKLLATLERSFSRMAGANGVVELNELRTATRTAQSSTSLITAAAG